MLAVQAEIVRIHSVAQLEEHDLDGSGGKEALRTLQDGPIVPLRIELGQKDFENKTMQLKYCVSLRVS